ncbi:MAG: hypothetical protein J5802_13065 [Butyrivibrio sp.]|nr:hypothetical protein [Butyrivibrio sp.]
MNINFQTTVGNKATEDSMYVGMEAEDRINKSAAKSGVSNAVAVNLGASLFSNDVYASHARGADEISEMAKNTDVQTQHNYMALLSNTMSEEDYAKALQDGFDVKNLNSSETVTILDKIKGVLLESGVEIVGYNDDMSVEKLTKITGSRSLAETIHKEFSQNDIPMTAENVRGAKSAYEEASQIEEPSDGAVKYMVLNNMKPTISNIYRAAHSTNGQNLSGRGFYAQEAGGYYAQKADNINWDSLAPQIDKVLEEAGFDVNDPKIRDNAKWMVEQGIPLTAENLGSLTELGKVEFPITEEAAVKAATAAIIDGKSAVQGNLADPESNVEKAVRLYEDTKKITDSAVKSVVEEEKELNLKNLILASDKENGVYPENPTALLPESDPKVVAARIQLEEVRLRMSVEANRNLLDRGFAIDTAPMQKLIEELSNMLKDIEGAQTGEIVDDITDVKPVNQARVYDLTLRKIETISKGPADISGLMAGRLQTATLSQISDVSANLARRFKAAGEGYEVMMTSPRADLGDSIKKAFRNVDDILKDLGEEVNDENRRAVRILGYNSMEINEENFENVRAWDKKFTATLERLKPGAVLDLIREGKNPLNMTLTQLSDSLDKGMFNDGGGEGEKRDSDRSKEKFSKFICKLERKNDITKEEKASFIGIYRLFHNLKANDYKAIGSVLKTGKDMTLGNLLIETRSGKTALGGIDYSIGDDFGGVDLKESDSKKIDEQINSAFRFYRSQADIVYENLEPEKLKAAKPSTGMKLEEFAEKLQREETDPELERAYIKDQIQEIRTVAGSKAAPGAITEMENLGVEMTFNNLEAMIGVRRDRRNGNLWNKAQELGRKDISKDMDALTDALDKDNYEETYAKSLENISDKLSDVLVDPETEYIDVKAITLMQKQISVMAHTAEKGSYEVPVEIDGSKVSMHITLRSDNSKISRMEASVQTIDYGTISVNLYREDGVVTGMLTTTNSGNTEEAEYLESVRTKMCDRLAENVEGVGVDQKRIAILYNAQAQPTKVGTVNADAMDGSNLSTTDTGTLLKMAKAFIEAL